ncbi:MAG: glycosyltransferase family 2 protein [Minisyncoccia bacterium]
MNQIKEPLLSVIIVNYNSSNYLKSCLNSIAKKFQNINYEVIVIDNASEKEKILSSLSQEYNFLKIIRNQKNFGFAKANNQGIKIAKGKYIFLLNPDTVILNTGINELINFLEENPKIGIIGPKILNSDLSFQYQCKRGWPTFWNAFTYLTKLYKLFPKNKKWQKIFGGYFLLEKDQNQIQKVDQVSGAAMIVRKEVFDKIGYLNEDYFLYWEDSDFCFRAQLAGFEIYYHPFLEIIHYGGKGGTQRQPFRNLWYFHRGLYIFYRKYLAKRKLFLVNWLYYFSIFAVFLLKLLLNLFRKKKIIGSLKPE